MRKLLAAATAITLALTLAGCPDDGGTSAKPSHAAPAPVGGPPPANNGGHNDGQGAQPAPAQGDPNAHNTEEGEVDLHVSWTSANSNTGACLWRKNGVESPCAGMKRAVLEPSVKKYIGLWETTTTGKAKDNFYLSFQGANGTESSECAIYFKGHPQPGEVHSGGRCSINVVLP